MKRIYNFIPFSIALIALSSCGNVPSINKDNNQNNLGASVNEVSFSLNDKTYSFEKDTDIKAGLSQIRELYNSMEQPILYDYTISEKNLINDEVYFNGSSQVVIYEEETNDLEVRLGYQKIKTNYKGSLFECERYQNVVYDKNTQLEKGKMFSWFKKDNKYVAGVYSTGIEIKLIYDGEKALPYLPSDDVEYALTTLTEATFAVNYFPICLINYDQNLPTSSRDSVNVFENTTYEISLYENYVVLSYISKLSLNATFLKLMDGTDRTKTDIYINTKTGFIDEMNIDGNIFYDGAHNVDIKCKMKKMSREEISSNIDECLEKNKNLYK